MRLRTFDEAFADFHLTPAEREALVWHLAAYRARRTVETLLGKYAALLALADKLESPDAG